MIYLIKLNLILALLCLLFQVLMHRDTFFGVRRLMLWGSTPPPFCCHCATCRHS